MEKVMSLKFYVGGIFVRKGSTLQYIGGTVKEKYDVDPDLIFVAGMKSVIEEDFACPNVTKLYYKIPELPLSSGCRLLNSDEAIRNLSAILVRDGNAEIYSEHVIVLTDEDIHDNVGFDEPNTIKTELDVGLEAIAADLESEEAEQANAFFAQGCLLDQDSNLVDVEISVCDNINENNTNEDADDEYFVCDAQWLSDNDDCEVQEAMDLIRKTKSKKTICQPFEVDTNNIAEHSKWFDIGISGGTCVENDDSSEYFSSDEYGSHVDTSDEDTDNACRLKSNRVYYRESDNPHFELSMIFEDKTQVKRAITAYSVKNKKDIATIKNDKERFRASCKWPKCPWAISVIYDKHEHFWQVKTFVDQHSCNQTFINNRVTSKWLAEKYGGRIRASSKWSVREIQQTVKEEYNVEVTESKCRRAKMIALNRFRDSFKEEYSKLWDYVEEIKSSNAGSSAFIQVYEDGLNSSPRFRKLYVCFNACKEGFLAGCRKVVGLDGCFLKGLIKGELLSAVGRDGNNQMYPIAWAVVEVESKESWRWFLRCLMRDLKMENGIGWTLITDQQKGLIPAIEELLPRAEHRMCARHIYANFRKKHNEKYLQKYFWKCAKSTTIPHFEQAVAELRGLLKEAGDDVLAIHPRHWCRAYFDKSVKCDNVDNNMSETFNAWIIEARYKPIISMLEEIRVKVMKRICVKMGEVSKWKTDYCPRILTKLGKMVSDSSKCHLEWNGRNGFEVKHLNNRFVVDIEKKTCTCNGWELSGIPCPHAVCAIFHVQKQPEMYLHEFYHKEMYIKAYDSPMQPLIIT